MTPEYRDLPEFHVAGLSDRFTPDRTEGIPGLWDRFMKAWSQTGRPCPETSYGLCMPAGEGEEEDGKQVFLYVAAIPVASPEEVPEGLEAFTVPASRYAVFTHRGPAHRIKETWHGVFCEWLPSSGHEHAPAPDFELYDSRFDPESETGEVDLYVPLRP